MDGAIRTTELEAFARDGARQSYDRWDQQMRAANGCIDDVPGAGPGCPDRLATTWYLEWLGADAALPNDLTAAQVARLEKAFVDEAVLLIETYDGPTPYSVGE